MITIGYLLVVFISAYGVIPIIKGEPLIRSLFIILLSTFFWMALREVKRQQDATLADLIIHFENSIRRVGRIVKSAPRSEKLLIAKLVVWYFILFSFTPYALNEYGVAYFTETQVQTTLEILKSFSSILFSLLICFLIIGIIKMIISEFRLNRASLLVDKIIAEIESYEIEVPLTHKNGICIVDIEKLQDYLLEANHKELYQKIYDHYREISSVEWLPYGKSKNVSEKLFCTIQEQLKNKSEMNNEII